MTNAEGFGLTSWDEVNNVGKKERKPKVDDSKKIPFIRLNKGSNKLRIITMPAKYWQIKFDDGKSPFGTRVNCTVHAAKKETRNNCPTVKAGYKPKKRYLAGVIDRSEEGGAIKLYDMSVTVYDALKKLKENEDYGVPTGYDVTIVKDPDAPPATFYTVQPSPPKPLSEADQELINSVGMDLIEENLIRLCTPPSVESCEAFLKKLGWDGVEKVQAIDSKSSDNDELEETSEKDYTFNRGEATA